MTASRFLAGNWEAELKPTTFSSFLLFRGFLSLLFSLPPSDIVHLSDIYIYGVKGVWFQLLRGQGARALVTLVLYGCVWNVPVVSLSLPTFDDTGCLGSPLRQVIYPPIEMVPPWVIASRFLAGNTEGELKPAIFSSLLLFRFLIFPLLLTPPP